MVFFQFHPKNVSLDGYASEALVNMGLKIGYTLEQHHLLGLGAPIRHPISVKANMYSLEMLEMFQKNQRNRRESLQVVLEPPVPLIPLDTSRRVQRENWHARLHVPRVPVPCVGKGACGGPGSRNGTAKSKVNPQQRVETWGIIIYMSAINELWPDMAWLSFVYDHVSSKSWMKIPYDSACQGCETIAVFFFNHKIIRKVSWFVVVFPPY